MDGCEYCGGPFCAEACQDDKVIEVNPVDGQTRVNVIKNRPDRGEDLPVYDIEKSMVSTEGVQLGRVVRPMDGRVVGHQVAMLIASSAYPSDKELSAFDKLMIDVNTPGSIAYNLAVNAIQDVHGDIKEDDVAAVAFTVGVDRELEIFLFDHNTMAAYPNTPLYWSGSEYDVHADIDWNVYDYDYKRLREFEGIVADEQSIAVFTVNEKGDVYKFVKKGS